MRQAYVGYRLDAPLFGPGNFPLSSSGPGTSSGSSGSTSFGTGGGGGSGHPEVWLMLAVLAVAVLPFVVYAVDSEADGLTIDRFFCPEFSFTAMAGVQTSTRGAEPPVALGVAKLRTTIGYIGVMGQVDIAPARSPIGSFSAHFLLRPQPKKHIEGGVALGGRRQAGPGGVLDGFEIALPHEYVFKRDGYRSLGLELMPRVFFNRNGVDMGVDVAMVIPVADILQLRVGGSVFSHFSQTQLGASAGLTAHL
jgi:hypothetical protein